MVNYRRTRMKGGIYFFTVTLRNRSTDLLTKHINELRIAMRTTYQKLPFHIYAIVVLPDHLHSIWQLPENDYDYSTRWMNIKHSFTRQLLQKGYQFKRANDGVYYLWQRRFWEHLICNEQDLLSHTNYIHYNPVKHGLITKVKDWPYSSFHKFCQHGLLDANWGGIEVNTTQFYVGE